MEGQMLSLNMSAHTQILRSKDGQRIGEIASDYDGIQVLRDRDGHRLGQYEPHQNVTRDSEGRRVGEGNLLASMLRP